MTIQDAIIAFFNEKAQEPNFDFNVDVEWLENHVLETVDSWADENGWEYNHQINGWVKKDS